MPIDYNNSWPLDVYKVSKHPNVKFLTTSLFKELMESGLYQRKPNKGGQSKVRSYVQLILLNAYNAHLYDEEMYIGYSRAESSYKKDSRYNKLFVSYSTFLKVIDKLTELGYIENIPGFRNRNTGFGRQSRFRATENLIQKIESFKIEQKMICRDTAYEEIIILKDKHKQLAEYEDTIKTKQMRRDLKHVNKALNKTFIGLYMSDGMYRGLKKKLQNSDEREPVNFNNKQLRRVFNNSSFDEGGRFYGGWWQNIPRQYRRLIVMGYIEDEYFDTTKIYEYETVELDYKSHHARMLYQLIDYDYGDKDPFKFKAYPKLRGVFKEAFYTMLNASSKRSAMGAIRKSIENNNKLTGQEITAKEVVEKIEKARHRIKQYFYTGIGLELQRKDAQIANKVMSEMLNQGIVTLTMHDSFIINAEYETELYECMENTFEETVGVKCEISRKMTFSEWADKFPSSYIKKFERSSFDTFYEYYDLWLEENGPKF